MRSRTNTRLAVRARRLAELLALVPPESRASRIVMLEAVQLVLDCGAANLLLAAGERVARLSDAEPVNEEPQRLKLIFDDASSLVLEAGEIGAVYEFQHVLAEESGSSAAVIRALMEAEQIVRFGDAEPLGSC